MNEYLNISQIARELNVSRQAIYSKLKSPEIQSVMCQYTVRHNNRTLYTSDFVNVLRQAFESVDTVQTLDTICQNEVSSPLQSQLDLLKATIDTLTIQLTEKDKQIAELTTALKTSQQQLTVAQEQQTALTTALTQQQALHAGDIQRQLTEQRAEDQAPIEQEQQPEKELAEDPSSHKLSWLQRLFGKRSK